MKTWRLKVQARPNGDMVLNLKICVCLQVKHVKKDNFLILS